MSTGSIHPDTPQKESRRPPQPSATGQVFTAENLLQIIATELNKGIMLRQNDTTLTPLALLPHAHRCLQHFFTHIRFFADSTVKKNK